MHSRALTPRPALPAATGLLLTVLAALTTGFPGCARAHQAVHAPAAHPAARRAAVATPDVYGADAAQAILRAGGNAVDAAVAVAFTLAVTYPEAGNLGGGGFATVFFQGRPAFLDFRERAPARASERMYQDERGEVVPDASTVGAGAAGVPGTVAGLWSLHARYGRLPWRADLAPAIRLAREGFKVDPGLAGGRDARADELSGRTNFLDYFGPRAGLVVGRRFRQFELGRTLNRIATGGAAGFYSGPTAELIVAEMRRSGGYIEPADLTGYSARWRAPLIGEWAGYEVITAPPPSAGGLMLLSMLAMKADLAPRFAGLTPGSAQAVHLVAEIEKRVFADRAEYLGDPDEVGVPVAALLDPAYLARRAAEVSGERPTALESVRPGLGPLPATAALAAAAPEHHQTTHFSVLDADGNAVAITYTLNDSFGSGQVVRGAGFLLNDEMDDFSAKPGVPNIFGVVGGRANAIRSGKRPLSSMTPTILLRDGRVALVIGTPGGSRIATTVFQVITHWHDDHMDMPSALAAARIHHQLLPRDTLTEEPFATLAPAVRAELAARGYQLEQQGWNNGDVEVVSVGPEGPAAFADPRGRGVARVFELPAAKRWPAPQ